MVGNYTEIIKDLRGKKLESLCKPASSLEAISKQLVEQTSGQAREVQPQQQRITQPSSRDEHVHL